MFLRAVERGRVHFPLSQTREPLLHLSACSYGLGQMTFLGALPACATIQLSTLFMSAKFVILTKGGNVIPDSTL